MMTYGDPPEPSECRDIGTLDIPTVLRIDAGLESDSVFQHLEPLSGSKLPRQALVREVNIRLAKRDLSTPVKAVAPGLGTMYAGLNGWLLEED